MFTRLACNQMFPGVSSLGYWPISVLEQGRAPKGQWRLWHVGCTGGGSPSVAVGPGAGHLRAAGSLGKRAGREGSLTPGRQLMVLGKYTPNSKLAAPETLNHPRYQAERPGG